SRKTYGGRIDVIGNKDFVTFAVAVYGSEPGGCATRKQLPWPNPKPPLWCSAIRLSPCDSASPPPAHAPPGPGPAPTYGSCASPRRAVPPGAVFFFAWRVSCPPGSYP